MIEADSSLRQIYTPNDVATYTIEAIEKRRLTHDFALRTLVPTIDSALRPLMPGELIFIMANTGQGKTSLMQFWARQVVKQLQQRPDIKDAVVYASWETITEELGLYDLCGITGVNSSLAWSGDVTDAEMEKLRVAAMRRAAMPLWVMAPSLKRRREGKGLTMTAVSASLERVEHIYAIKPAIIFIDYLQIITPENVTDDRRIQVLRSVDALRQLGRDCGAPVVVGSQAGRQVLERDDKLPEIGDGQESSRQEQDADRVLALWYPCKTEGLGTRLSDYDVEVNDRLMLLGIRKQRHAASGQVILLDFDAAHNTFASWQEGATVGTKTRDTTQAREEADDDRMPF
jgi:replicative DNA helicase